MGQIALSSVSKKPRDDWRGYFAYLLNKEANGANSRSILAVWYAWITLESGKTIYGNNPLNLTCGKGDGCYTGQIGWYQFPGNTRKFAAFDSPQSAAKAYIGLLTRGTAYRYPKILEAARADKWQDMITAIITSCWVSCNRPGYGGVNGSFWKVWNSMRTAVDKDIASGKIGNVPTSGTPDMLGAWGDIVQFPVGHTLTEADIDTIISKLEAAGFFGSGVLKFGKDETRNILMRHVGEQWTKELQDKLQAEFFGAADAAVDNPLNTIATILTRVLNPENWLRIGALVIGLILAFMGFASVMNAAGATPRISAA